MHLRPAELLLNRHEDMDNGMDDSCTSQANRLTSGLMSRGQGLRKSWQTRKFAQGRVAQPVHAFPTSKPRYDADEYTGNDPVHLMCTDLLPCNVKEVCTWKGLQQEPEGPQCEDAHSEQPVGVVMIEDLVTQVSQVSVSQFVPRSVHLRNKMK